MAKPSPSPDVYIVLVTHNGAEHLPEQLDSITSQTLRPSGVILVDDGSSDDSVQIVLTALAAAGIAAQIVPAPWQAAAAHDEQVDVNTRIAANFAAGLAASPRGCFVAFADQDDVWYPHHLRTLRDALARNPVRAYAFSNALYIADDGGALPGCTFDTYAVPKRFSTWTGPRQLRALTTSSLVTGMTMMVRRDRVIGAFPAPPGILHDRWISLATCPRGGGAAVPTALSAYRQHQRQVLGAVSGAGFFTRLKGMVGRAIGTKGRTVFLTDLSRAEHRALLADPAFERPVWQRILRHFGRIIAVKSAVNRIILGVFVRQR